jgi:hypothetical protein
MNYFVDLFSPETAAAYEKSDKAISGFRVTQKTYVENKKIGPGDKFICYVTRLQRFIGILEVEETYFIDDKPIFANENDPFTLRFKVKPLVWLPLEKTIPIREDFIWNKLSFTKNLPKDSNNWTYVVFASPRLWPKEDGGYLESMLIEQSQKMVDYPLSEDEIKKLKPQKIKIGNRKEVTVSVPDDEEEKIEAISVQEVKTEKRESIRVQAKLSEIGEKLGMKIWLPKGDRDGVLEIWNPKEDILLEDLPFSFDDVTIKTIKNIDVLWIRGRAIVRAFEVEDTTSIYSGILRMADLLSMLPSLKITIHLVAPDSRRNDVFKQISRPVFSVMESGPLSELCSYISYNSVYELAKEKQLENMKDTIVDEYSEYLED